MNIFYTITCGVLIHIIEKLVTFGIKPRGVIITPLVGIAGTMLKKSSGLS